MKLKTWFPWWSEKKKKKMGGVVSQQPPQLPLKDREFLCSRGAVRSQCYKVVDGFMQVSDDSVQELLHQYELFIHLKAINGPDGGALSPSPAVDAVWHEHILNTKMYHKFCTEHIGWFVHHEPDVPAYAETLALFDELGIEPDERWWPTKDDDTEGDCG